MAKVLTVPVIGMELKQSTPVAGKAARQYILITFRVGSMFNSTIKKTTVLIDENPEIAKMQMDFFTPMIQSKNYGTLQGSFFNVGDKSLDPNTIELPLFRYKLSDGTLSAPTNSIRVFVLLDSETGEYFESPQKKALSIINNPDLCSLVEISPSPANIDESTLPV